MPQTTLYDRTGATLGSVDLADAPHAASAEDAVRECYAKPKCGDELMEPRVIGDGFAGYTHPEGTCDPEAVKARRAWLDETSERNAVAAEVQRMRASADAARWRVSLPSS